MTIRPIPNKPRYDYVKRTARKVLLSNNIASLPTDIDAIFKNNNILLFSEIQAEQMAMCTMPHEFSINNKIQAITQNRTVQSKSIFITIYKERNRVAGNIRFSKAHELGHIFLKHFEDFEIPSSLNISTSREYWILEREAEMFAAELLAPTAILRACNCFDKRSIQLLCNLSGEASEYVISDINRDYHLKESDKAALECQFDSFIRSKKYLLLTSDNFCQTCGSPTHSKDQYCRICGATIVPSQNKENVFLYPSDIPVKETGRVYYCVKCGNINISMGVKVCNLCNAPLYNFCTSCNTKLSGNDRYCGTCGNVSTFFNHSLLESWSKVQDRYKGIGANHILDLKKIECWEYILDKLLRANKLDVYQTLAGSSGYEDSGKLIIASHAKISCLVSDDTLLSEINALCLPYFDTTYDDIEVIYTH